MKRSITVAALFMAAVYAQAAEDTKPEKTATAPAAITIPKDAVKSADGTYSYTDKQGKKWIYRNSPFGVVKTVAPESGPDARENPKQGAATTKVIDKGDTVQFERSTPFGLTKWEKKKSDLTDEERKIVDSQTQSKSKTDNPDSK